MLEGVIPKAELAKHVQLLLTDRSDLTVGREFGVMSPLTWRLGDLFAKHAFLLKGLGWGGMPVHAVKQDLQQGRLVKLSIEDVPDEGLILPMFAVYLAAKPPGPAGRWLACANVPVAIAPMRKSGGSAHLIHQLAHPENNGRPMASAPMH
jgi:DNA-binding transcriptional LysR family regulator